MRLVRRFSLSLAGRIVAIILAAIAVEFAVSILLYERASEFSIRGDDSRRLAEHLFIVRRLIGEQPPEERPLMARYLSTGRYQVEWMRNVPTPPPVSPDLREMRDEVLAWEPALADHELRMQLVSPGRADIIQGEMQLDDGSWVIFRMYGVFAGWEVRLHRIILALAPALALAALGMLLVRRTLRPIAKLAEASTQVGDGDWEMVKEEGPSEVRDLIHAFNLMQARIQRMISDQRQTLAAVGHDLRTPLARLKLRVDRISDPQLRLASDSDLTEMEAMVESVLDYLGGEEDPEKPVRVDIAVLLATIADDFIDRGHDCDYDGPAHLEALLRAGAMKRAVTNLVENAVHHGTRVRILLRRDGEEMMIAVEDNGPGIPEEEVEAMLQPFVRRDTARGRDTKGLGLGLSIVERLVTHEKGRLHLVNRAEGGLRAEIFLPCQAQT